MKLIYRITLRISVALFLLFALWGSLFYYIIIDEINDETDDSLEDYSEYIITRALSGEQLPEKDNGTNNTYYITEVSEKYAINTPAVRYLDEEIYLFSKKETEPARIYKTIFKDRDNHYHELTVMIPAIEKDDLKKTILFWIIMLYLLLLLAIIIVNAAVIRRNLLPFYSMLAWLDKLTLGREVPDLKVETDISEFKKLSENLKRSAQRNAEMYEQQSLFIGHASHELQTPIAIAKNRLELLADDPDLNESQLEQIIKTRRSLEDISKLNKTLLLFAKIENKQFPDSTEININEMLTSIVSDFDEAYAYLGITHEIKENVQLKIKMNKMLALVFFSNLIKNAYTHNHEGGKVSLVVNKKNITISNTSSSMALNPDYIFKPFYHDTKKEGSVGLGLSLVESIRKHYEMNLSYYYDNGIHKFNVSIPDSLLSF